MKKLLAWSGVVAPPLVYVTVSVTLPWLVLLVVFVSDAIRSPTNQNLLNLILFFFFGGFLFLLGGIIY